MLLRHPAVAVTAWSIARGALAMAPLALLGWAGGLRPAWSKRAFRGGALG